MATVAQKDAVVKKLRNAVPILSMARINSIQWQQRIRLLES